MSWPVEWDAVPDMQHFATRYAQRCWSGELADRARLSACELLDNAARYATAGGSIELTIVEIPCGFDVRVTNDTVDARLELLRRRLQETLAPDVSDRYRRALRRLLSLENASGAGLGLLRIRHEANVDLAMSVEGKRVTVSASGSTLSAATPKGETRDGRSSGQKQGGGDGTVR